MKIIVTGGHFSPAFALARELIQKKHEVLIAGRKNAFEGDSAESFEFIESKKYNIPFFEIKAGRLQRKLTKHSVQSFFKTPFGLISALKMVDSFKPDVVITFGGYISIPVAFAAFLRRVPVVVHEQTQRAGLANKIISLFASKVCITFSTSGKYFQKNKTILTGNPIRPEVFKADSKIDVPKDLKIIYVTGGSSGSHFINDLVKQVLPDLLSKYVVIHQSGNSNVFHDYENLSEYKKSLSPNLRSNYILREFINPREIGWVLQNASLVVSRAGINTVLELMALKKLSFLIPLPHGQTDEQDENAKLIEENGLGVWAKQENLDASKFLQIIDDLINNEKKYIDNHKNSQSYTDPAVTRILDVVQLVYEKSGKKKDQNIV